MYNQKNIFFLLKYYLFMDVTFKIFKQELIQNFRSKFHKIILIFRLFLYPHQLNKIENKKY